MTAIPQRRRGARRRLPRTTCVSFSSHRCHVSNISPARLYPVLNNDTLQRILENHDQIQSRASPPSLNIPILCIIDALEQRCPVQAIRHPEPSFTITIRRFASWSFVPSTRFTPSSSTFVFAVPREQRRRQSRVRHDRTFVFPGSRRRWLRRWPGRHGRVVVLWIGGWRGSGLDQRTGRVVRRSWSAFRRRIRWECERRWE